MFDEIEKMQTILDILSPYMEEDLGVLLDPDDSSETDEPAFYLDGNYVPESTLPRIVMSYNGSQNGFVTRVRSYQEENPDYVEGGDESEYLYYTDREYHTTYSLTFTVDSGDTTEVLTGNRKSANYIARKLRIILGRDAVRNSIHEDAESGVDYISNEQPQVDQDGVVLVGSSVTVVNFTTLNVDSEEIDGIISTVEWQSNLYDHEDDTDPLQASRSVTDPY